jgi:hypothetical protein
MDYSSHNCPEKRGICKDRELAEMAKDAATKQELLELAAACEGIADQIDDLRSSG